VADVTPKETGDNARGKIAAIIALLLLLAVGFWLVHRLGETAAVQDCVATGHRDCDSDGSSAP
jgi:hypothetical protein